MRRFYFDLVGSRLVSDEHGLLFRDLRFAAHFAERLAADLFTVRPELRGTACVVMSDKRRSDVIYCIAIATERTFIKVPPSACPGEVGSGSPTRTCANTRIYGASRSYWITGVIQYDREAL
jgi:hypothetical protein